MERTPHDPVRSRSHPANTEGRLRLLIDTGLLLASEGNLDRIVQAAVEAGLHLCGARFGVFFYHNTGEDGELLQLCKAAATDPTALAPPHLPQEAGAFTAIFPAGNSGAANRRIRRVDDLTQSTAIHRLPRYGDETPFPGMRPGHPPIRSFLAVPVRSPADELLGGLCYGHPSAAIFDPGCEQLVATVASQAAVSIDHARLAATLSREIALADNARQLQRETAGRLRQALDAAQLGTWSWDRATDLLDLDERAAELFHVQPHAHITRTAIRDRVVLAEDREPTLKSLQRSLESGGFYTAEYRVGFPGAAPRWVAARGMATFAPGSQAISGMVGTVQDITARKNSEAALRESEKLAAAGRLAATIAHEINNPLEAVTNLIYLSKTDPAVPDPVKDLLDTADHELARVAQIAQQTLGFYRDTGRPVDIDLNELLQGASDIFARRMKSRHITCTLDLEPGLRLFGFPGEIRQVVSNLLVNAIDASTGEGAIHIRARRRVRHDVEGIALLVGDCGAGIPLDVRTRLFSPFFTTKETVGTGLGLWVTRGIVEKQGGSISFRSRTEPPSGTVFRIFLPRFGKVSDGRQTQ